MKIDKTSKFPNYCIVCHKISTAYNQNIYNIFIHKNKVFKNCSYL